MPLSISRPAPLASAMRGATPMPTTTKSHSVTCGAHTRHRTVALERLDTLTERQLDPMLTVDVTVERADLGTKEALQRQRDRIDDRDVEPCLSRRGGELAADPASADDNHMP